MQGHDEKEFLDLLIEFRSDETKKARRNLSTVAFVVLAAWILGVRLTDVKVFGVDLSRTAELYVLLLGLCLLLYWAMMFGLSWRHDKEIQKERATLLTAKAEQLLARMKANEESKKQNERVGYVLGDYGQVKAAVELYERQKARTAKVSSFGHLIASLELYVPMGLGALSAVILIVGVIRAL